MAPSISATECPACGSTDCKHTAYTATQMQCKSCLHCFHVPAKKTLEEAIAAPGAPTPELTSLMQRPTKRKKTAAEMATSALRRMASCTSRLQDNAETAVQVGKEIHQHVEAILQHNEQLTANCQNLRDDYASLSRQHDEAVAVIGQRNGEIGRLQGEVAELQKLYDDALAEGDTYKAVHDSVPGLLAALAKRVGPSDAPVEGHLLQWIGDVVEHALKNADSGKWYQDECDNLNKQINRYCEVAAMFAKARQQANVFGSAVIYFPAGGEAHVVDGTQVTMKIIGEVQPSENVGLILGSEEAQKALREEITRGIMQACQPGGVLWSFRK